MVPAIGLGFQRVAGAQIADIGHAVTLYPVATATGQRLPDNGECATSKIRLSVFPNNHSAGRFRARGQAVVGDGVSRQRYHCVASDEHPLTRVAVDDIVTNDRLRVSTQTEATKTLQRIVLENYLIGPVNRHAGAHVSIAGGRDDIGPNDEDPALRVVVRTPDRLQGINEGVTFDGSAAKLIW